TTCRGFKKRELEELITEFWLNILIIKDSIEYCRSKAAAVH
ncbi:hypothetical protein GCK32_016277, partial [Trichostrongylus colubriformis]